MISWTMAGLVAISSPSSFAIRIMTWEVNGHLFLVFVKAMLQ